MSNFDNNIDHGKDHDLAKIPWNTLNRADNTGDHVQF